MKWIDALCIFAASVVFVCLFITVTVGLFWLTTFLSTL